MNPNAEMGSRTLQFKVRAVSRVAISAIRFEAKKKRNASYRLARHIAAHTAQAAHAKQFFQRSSRGFEVAANRNSHPFATPVSAQPLGWIDAIRKILMGNKVKVNEERSEVRR
jgi:hypothetical protein